MLVKVEGRSKSDVARDYRVSRRWVQKLVARYDTEGEAAYLPRSRRPRSPPTRVSDACEVEIVELRTHLTDQGLDAGAETIRVHLLRSRGTTPALVIAGRT